MALFRASGPPHDWSMGPVGLKQVGSPRIFASLQGTSKGDLMARTIRTNGNTAWNAWRAFVGGVIYLGAAFFNALYTLPRANEPGTFDGYADGAWFGLLEQFIRDVFAPNGMLFMAAVVVFEIVVGLLILSRGTAVDWGIGASLLWVLAIMPFLAWPYVLVNVGLVFVQGAVVLRRYDASIWNMLRNPAALGEPASR